MKKIFLIALLVITLPIDSMYRLGIYNYADIDRGFNGDEVAKENFVNQIINDNRVDNNHKIINLELLLKVISNDISRHYNWLWQIRSDADARHVEFLKTLKNRVQTEINELIWQERSFAYKSLVVGGGSAAAYLIVVSLAYAGYQKYAQLTGAEVTISYADFALYPVEEIFKWASVGLQYVNSGAYTGLSYILKYVQDSVNSGANMAYSGLKGGLNSGYNIITGTNTIPTSTENTNDSINNNNLNNNSTQTVNNSIASLSVNADQYKLNPIPTINTTFTMDPITTTLPNNNAKPVDISIKKDYTIPPILAPINTKYTMDKDTQALLRKYPSNSSKDDNNIITPVDLSVNADQYKTDPIPTIDTTYTMDKDTQALLRKYPSNAQKINSKTIEDNTTFGIPNLSYKDGQFNKIEPEKSFNKALTNNNQNINNQTNNLDILNSITNLSNADKFADYNPDYNPTFFDDLYNYLFSSEPK